MQGSLYEAQDKKQQALDCLERAVVCAPERGDILYNYGVLLQDIGKTDEAMQAWRRAVEIDPSCLRAWQNAGHALSLSGATGEAVAVYKEALTHHPNDRALLFAYGLLCYGQHDWPEACRIFAQLAQDYPQDSEILANAGRIYKTAGFYEKAEAYYRRALALADPARQVRIIFNYAHLLLVQGRWREGFATYEARLQLPGAMAVPWGLPPWRANLPRGSRILVWNDQGLGDGIMFARFIPRLIEKGYRISAFVQQPLRKIMESMWGLEAVFDPMDDPQPFDAALALASLPFVLDASPENFWRGTYFSVPPESSFLVRDSPRPRIGIVWAGNPLHCNDKNRSMTFTAFAPLLELAVIEWISLQQGPGAEEAAGHSPSLREMGPMLGDMAAVAAVIARLDLVICVDTAVAHMAGALGKPAWVLLPAANSDWRWGLTGTESLWYPSLRLFRQSKPGDWHDVIAAIRVELALLYSC